MAFARSRGRAVFARHAASVIVVRGLHPAGVAEVLMGMRGAGHRFMPNRLVFPGGKVDPQDYGAPVASELRPEVARYLQRAARPRLARALAVAAARELEEESGLSLSRGAPGRAPALDGLDYLCRAITPRALPMRFNVRFFVIDADRLSGAIAGSGELEDLRFIPLPEALTLEIAPVTRKVIEQLNLFLGLSDAGRAERAFTPLLRERGWECE